MKTADTKTYLFDFDGTLVDSMPAYIALMLRILDDNGVKYGDDIVKIITPLGYGGTADYFRELGISMPKDELVGLMNKYAQDEYSYKIPAKDTVIDTLAVLKERGCSLNVLTASPHNMLDPCLIRLGMWDLFDNVWSCEDFNTTKSDPEIYRLAAEKIGRAVGEIIFIDDNANAVKTAKSAGMISYGIYDASSADYAQEMKAISDRYLEQMSDLLDT